MDYDRSDTSGTDDDLPPAQPGWAFRGGRVAGNGRSTSGGHYGRMAAEQELRKFEQDAYITVLQAFSAQSEVITWAKEQLMSSLRKELRISEEQHLKFVMGIESNGTSRKIRERRMKGDERMYAPPIMEPAPTAATTLGARKKQKTAHIPQAAHPPPTVKCGIPSPRLASIAAAKRVPASGLRGKKSKGDCQQPNASAMVGKCQSLGADGSVQSISSWIGAKVKTRWPADNTFYEAVITDYNPETGLHALVYEMNTENETWEWVNLDELSPRDLKIVSVPSGALTGKGVSTSANFTGGVHWANTGRAMKKPGGKSALGGRDRSGSKGPTSSFEKSVPSSLTLRTGADMKGSKPFQLPPLDPLLKQVDKIAEEDDLAKIESIKQKAKEHEKMIRKALAEIGESSDDGESADEDSSFSRGHTMDQEKERRSRQDSRNQHGDDEEDDTAGDQECSDGEPLVGEVGVASDGDDDHQDGEDG